MPTYEYKCGSCEIEFERFQRISDDPIKKCPECGGEVQRLISTGGGLVFKGPGFYATDYGSGSSGGAGSERKTDKGDSGDSPGGKAGGSSTAKESTDGGG